MRLHVQTDGGFSYFPALNKPTVVDSSALPEPEAEELRQLVDSSNFFALPPAAPLPSSPKAALRHAGSYTTHGADQRQYLITIEEEDGTSHTVRVKEPIEDPHLQALISFARSQKSARQPSDD